jgi:hypothetical protein
MASLGEPTYTIKTLLGIREHEASDVLTRQLISLSFKEGSQRRALPRKRTVAVLTVDSRGLLFRGHEP